MGWGRGRWYETWRRFWDACQVRNMGAIGNAAGASQHQTTSHTLLAPTCSKHTQQDRPPPTHTTHLVVDHLLRLLPERAHMVGYPAGAAPVRRRCLRFLERLAALHIQAAALDLVGPALGLLGLPGRLPDRRGWGGVRGRGDKGGRSIKKTVQVVGQAGIRNQRWRGWQGVINTSMQQSQGMSE